MCLTREEQFTSGLNLTSSPWGTQFPGNQKALGFLAGLPGHSAVSAWTVYLIELNSVRADAIKPILPVHDRIEAQPTDAHKKIVTTTCGAGPAPGRAAEQRRRHSGLPSPVPNLVVAFQTQEM